MMKKLLILLPVILLFEFALYLFQAQKIKDLDREVLLRTMSKRRVISPSGGFADVLARVNIPNSQVLGISDEPTPTPEANIIPQKESYVIAAIGDSMIETMGDSLDYLKAELKEKYPGTEFAMYNYGIGAEKVTGGIERFDKPFQRGSRNYPPLTHLKPDILIVGSYAYNPFDEYNRDGHWLALADLAVKARNLTPNTYILAEVAPLEKEFGKGPGGVNWPENIIAEHVPKIIEQMENAFGIAGTLGIPLIDVYDKTRAENSKYGKAEYVSSHDNIHPSAFGQAFTAEQEAEVIRLD